MKKILIQLDTDPQPSSFDRVVAVDAGVDELFSYGGVIADGIEPLVHGAMFTRGPDDLKNTALFIGGSDVAAGEAVLEQVRKTFFGPMRVSVMMDSNGSNTTAAAAVKAAAKHLDLAQTEALVLGGTGPVGLRAAQILASQGASVHVASRSRERAEQACKTIAGHVEGAKLTPCSFEADEAAEKHHAVQLVIAAGAAGVQFLDEKGWQSAGSLKVAIDLNAVPPVGLQGIEVTDKAVERAGVICYGAIGVGGTKMKVHRAAIGRLFESNSQVLDTAAIYEIAMSLG
ncbi:Bifunctional protein MdtA [Maioricimonas rarisocia]|uniref:Bifunctional protein MdtA n=1 Tax=Maioricimonas rarisocia TaxID=2528026 RepID=A0A517Z258_9PLAN|nr:NAD(P)-dependent methylenetetrahydromethanopterin dehydrogenase [Maioricimonas rarisocia]QDU36563.1 Bifunctional protein MdtA [Maioricimonas rarisocia]